MTYICGCWQQPVGRLVFLRSLCVKAGERMEKDLTVPLWEKYLLTIEEAAVYFGIGENRLRELAALDMKREFTIDNGNRTLIKRKKFEGWLDEKKKISL